MKKSLLLLAAASSVLVSCGGDSSSGSTPGAPPVTSPAPSPSPTPAPTPTPTAAVDPGGANLAGMSVPGSLDAVVACLKTTATLDQGKVVGVGPIAAGLSDQSLSIFIDAAFRYEVDINGFGGPTLGADQRKGGIAFESFVSANNGDEAELQISKSSALKSATLGFLNYYSPCFFAAAPRAPRAASVATGYRGLVDGWTIGAGDVDRLYGGSATMTSGPANENYTLSLVLTSIENAFAEPSGQSQIALGTATGSLTLTTSTLALDGVVSAPGGYTGTISGRIGGTAPGAALLSFDMSNPAGNRIVGVVAADAF